MVCFLGISDADYDEQNSEEEISKLGETSSQEPPLTEKNEALEGKNWSKLLYFSNILFKYTSL